jgi:hypothetical protein
MVIGRIENLERSWDDISKTILAHIPSDPQPFIKKETKRIGWICPRCGAANSPVVMRCTCNPAGNP